MAGDPFRIRQIADNLISNALKFTDEGSVTIRVDVVQGRLVFSVRDTGRGIGREEKERIFQEFVRLRSAQGVDGFGLGLSIVDRLVKLLEGTISLESRLGEGSKFIVSIPVGTVSGGGGRKLRPAEAALPAACGGVKALLIDDDPLQARNDRRDVPSGGCRSRVLSVPRIRREIGCGRRLRRGADRHTDAVGRRFQRPCGGARRESRASRGGGFGTRGVGSRGFLGARLCGVPAQALYGQRA